MHNGRSLLQEQSAAAFAQVNPGNNKFLLLRQQAAAKMLQQRGSINTFISSHGSSAAPKHAPAANAKPSQHHSVAAPSLEPVAVRVQKQQAAVPIPAIEDMPAVSQATRQAAASRRAQQHVDPSVAPAAPAGPRGPSPPAAVESTDSLDTRIAKAAHTPNFASEVDDHGIPAIARVVRESCRFCQRQFAVDRLSKHMVVCQQSIEKEKSRKVADLRAKRVEALYAENHAEGDAPDVVRKLEAEERLGSSTGSQQKSTAKWRIESAQFQRAMKGDATAAQPPPEDDRVPCPYCGRKFSENAAERHIPKCGSKPKGPR
jgi:hypothetical protein